MSWNNEPRIPSLQAWECVKENPLHSFQVTGYSFAQSYDLQIATADPPIFHEIVWHKQITTETNLDLSQKIPLFVAEMLARIFEEKPEKGVNALTPLGQQYLAFLEQHLA